MSAPAVAIIPEDVDDKNSKKAAQSPKSPSIAKKEKDLTKPGKKGKGTGKTTRKFPCQWQDCHYVASSSIGLERHVRTHTGEKPFACPHCPYRATIAVNLRRHINTHTGPKARRAAATSPVYFPPSRMPQHPEQMAANSMLLGTRNPGFSGAQAPPPGVWVSAESMSSPIHPYQRDLDRRRQTVQATPAIPSWTNQGEMGRQFNQEDVRRRFNNEQYYDWRSSTPAPPPSMAPTTSSAPSFGEASTGVHRSYRLSNSSLSVTPPSFSPPSFSPPSSQMELAPLSHALRDAPPLSSTILNLPGIRDVSAVGRARVGFVQEKVSQDSEDSDFKGAAGPSSKSRMSISSILS